MALIIDDRRRREKGTVSAGVLPTVPPNEDHTTTGGGAWLDTDIHERELYVNAEDGIMYTRTGGEILEISEPDGVISGMEVVNGTNAVKFTVNTGEYRASKRRATHATTIDEVTINDGDGSFDRFDLIIIDKTDVASIVEGTPSGSPVAPTLTQGQILLATILVPTGHTSAGSPIPPTLPSIGMDDLSDATVTAAANEDILVYNTGTGNWENQAGRAFARTSISVAAGSSSYISYNNSTGEISVTALAITDVTVDGVEISLAAYVAANYTVGDEHQEGDTIVLTAATGGTKIYMHNGGVAGTVADFVEIQTPSATSWSSVLAASNTTGANDTIYSKTGTATSTITQVGSQKLQFQTSLWDGGAESIETWDIEAIASTTANQKSRVAFTTGGVEMLSVDADFVGINTDTRIGGEKLAVNGKTLIDSLAAIGAYTAGQAEFNSVSNTSNTDYSVRVTDSTGDLYLNSKSTATVAVRNGNNRVAVFSRPSGAATLELGNTDYGHLYFNKSGGTKAVQISSLVGGSLGGRENTLELGVDATNTTLEAIQMVDINNGSPIKKFRFDVANDYVGILSFAKTGSEVFGVKGEARIVGAGATTSTYGLQVHNSSGTSNSFMVKDNSTLSIGRLPVDNVSLVINSDLSATGTSLWLRDDWGATTDEFIVKKGWAAFGDTTAIASEKLLLLGDELTTSQTSFLVANQRSGGKVRMYMSAIGNAYTGYDTFYQDKGLLQSTDSLVLIGNAVGGSVYISLESGANADGVDGIGLILCNNKKVFIGNEDTTALSQLHVKNPTASGSVFRLSSSTDVDWMFVQHDGIMGFNQATPVAHMDVVGLSSISENPWGTDGIFTRHTGGEFTDNLTTTSGTNSALQVMHSFGGSAIGAQNASVTFSDVATIHISAPTAGTNATVTNAWAAVFEDKTSFESEVRMQGGLNWLGYIESGAAPTTTELPTDKDVAVHRDTVGGAVTLAFNESTTIRTVTLA